MRYPSLNSNNPYLIPPPHPTPGLLAPLLLLQLITKPTLSPHVTSQAFPHFHLSAIATEQSLKTYNSNYVQASSLPAWCASQEHRQAYVPVAASENPHTQFSSPPSFTL